MVHAPQGHERGVRERFDQRVGGAGEVTVAEHDQHRARDLAEDGGVEAWATAADAGGERGAVDAGLGRQAGEVLHDRVGRVSVAGDGAGDDVGRAVVAEQVGADPGDDDAGEAAGIVGRQRQDDAGSQREADGVDGPVGEMGGHAALEGSVRLGVVGLVRLPVTEQVGRDDRAADVAQEVDPAVVPPRASGGRGEAVDEEHRFVAHGRRFYTGGQHRDRVGARVATAGRGRQTAGAHRVASRGRSRGHGNGAAVGAARHVLVFGGAPERGRSMGGEARSERARAGVLGATRAGTGGEQLRAVEPGGLRRAAVVALVAVTRAGRRRRRVRRGRAGLPRGLDLHRGRSRPAGVAGHVDGGPPRARRHAWGPGLVLGPDLDLHRRARPAPHHGQPRLPAPCASASWRWCRRSPASGWRWSSSAVARRRPSPSGRWCGPPSCWPRSSAPRSSSSPDGTWRPPMPGGWRGRPRSWAS